MLYRFRITSKEVDDFVREIVIDADASFLDLGKAILSACGYPDDQMTSFYICDDEWEKTTEITREDMGVGASDEDIYVMADTRISEFVEDKDARIKFVFDPFQERSFVVALKEIIFKKNSKQAQCTLSQGQAPVQIKEEETPTKGGKSVAAIPTGDLFDEDEGLDADDIDPESFEISDGNPFED